MTNKTFDEEVMEAIDDTERLSNKEWNKKYGDRTYLEVLKSLIRTRIDSCPDVDGKYKYYCHSCDPVSGKALLKSDVYSAFGIDK